MMHAVQTDMSTQSMFEFTAEHYALRDVLRRYFSSTSTLDPGDRWQRLLVEVGVEDILWGSAGDGFRETAIELAILAEESGAALFGGPLLSAAALGTLSSVDESWAAVIEQVRGGQRGVSAAVSLACFGGSPVAVSDGADGYRADGLVEPVWDFAADAFVVVDGSLGGESVIALFDTTAVDFAALSVLDPSRPLGRIQCRAAAPLAANFGEPAADALTAIRRRCDLIISAELLGVAQHVLDATVEYASQRVQFGRSIGSFQAVKHRLADMLAQVELTRSAVYAAAWQIGDRPAANQTELDLAVAAVLARESAVAVTKQAVQLHGGIAITSEHWAHRYLRRAHSMVALTGDARRHRRRIAALLDTGDGRDG